jgi:hypothetical protein
VDDFHLLQALHATRRLTAGRAGAAWRGLDERAERLLGQMTGRAPDPLPGEYGEERLLRTDLSSDQRATAVAALRALEERPDDASVANADRSLAALERTFEPPAR